MIAAAAASPETECVITADGAETTVVCTGNSAEQALAAAGVELLDGDSCSVQERGGVLYVDVVRAKVVSLTVNGQTEFFRTGCGTVGAFLAERGIALDSHDAVSADPDAAVTDGMAITVSRTDTQTVAMQVDVAYETEYRDDPDAYEGETAVVQEGKNGAKSITYTITSKDGVVTGLKAGDEQLLYQPVPQIVAVGTKPRPAQEAGRLPVRHPGRHRLHRPLRLTPGTRLRACLPVLPANRRRAVRYRPGMVRLTPIPKC